LYVIDFRRKVIQFLCDDKINVAINVPINVLINVGVSKGTNVCSLFAFDRH